MEVSVGIKIMMSVCALLGGLGQAFVSAQDLHDMYKDKKTKKETKNPEAVSTEKEI